MTDTLFIIFGIILSIMHFFITKNNQRYMELGQLKLEIPAIKSFFILSGSIIFCFLGMGFFGLFFTLAAQVLGQLAGTKEAQILRVGKNSFNEKF